MTASHSFPVRIVMGASVLTIALVASVVWLSWEMYRTHEKIQAQEIRLRELDGTIIHLSEVLTTSTRLAAATDDQAWEARYLHFKSKLDAAIKEAAALEPAAVQGEAAQQVIAANAILAAMTRQAFDLARQGHRDVALALLSGKQYREQQRLYAQGLEQITSALSRQAAAHHRAQLQRAAFIAASFVGAVALILSTWLYVLRVASRRLREREKAEEALRALEEHYRLLFKQGPLPMYIFEEDTLAILAVNDAAIQHYGYSNDEFLAMTSAEIRPPEEIPRLQAYLRENRNPTGTKFIQAGVWRHRKKDGTVFDAEISNRHIMFLGKPARLVLVHDITERKKQESDLQASELRYRRLFEAAQDGILIMNPETTLIEDVNPFLTHLLGYARSEIVGKTLGDIGFARDLVESKLNFETLKTSGFVRYENLPLQSHDGQSHAVEFISNVYAVDGKSVIQCNIRDISERVGMQLQASRLERLAALGQLLGGIAHEIKNPLFIVTGHLQLLKERLASREYESLEGDIQSIEEACDRILLTTKRFLNLARPMKMQWQRCSIHDVLSQSLTFLANELMKNRIQVVRAFASDIPQIWSEPRQLHGVFLNLILNAMQAMTAAHGQGTLTITTRCENDSIVIRIQDDGPGISPQHLDKVFEPFFSTKPTGQGTGLGLWTAQGSMAGLNGTVKCETAEGKGSTFIVSIPIATDPPKE